MPDAPVLQRQQQRDTRERAADDQQRGGRQGEFEPLQPGAVAAQNAEKSEATPTFQIAIPKYP